MARRPRLKEQRGDIRLDIRTQGPRTSLTLRVQPISDALKATVAARALDLTRIAAYVYWADQMASRGGDADISGDRWRRSFEVCAPVSDPDFWNDVSTSGQLCEVLGFLSEDVWSFHFSKSLIEEQLYLDTDPRAPRRNPDCVVLFSGGVDSLCAAVEVFKEHTLKPALVSHWSTPMVDHRQEALVGHLRSLIPQWFFPRATILVNKARSREREITQRTRSFLFASLAAEVASALGISDVILTDNGVVSLNLPINDQLVGALASRSTHPKFINLFNNLIRDALPHAPQLRNPLWNRTRTEALGILEGSRVPELLQETNSCSHGRGLPNVTPHCGTCSQCIDRRFASIAAGLEHHDLVQRYKADIFRDELTGDALTAAQSYVRFARKVRSMSDEELFEEYPQMNDCILVGDPAPHLTATALARLVKRHASETMRVLQDQVERASKELVLHTLPPTCLTQIAIERERLPTSSKGLPKVVLSTTEERAFREQRFRSRQIIQVPGR